VGCLPSPDISPGRFCYWQLNRKLRANSGTASLGRCKGGIDKTLSLIKHTFIAQRVRQLGYDIAQHFAATPLLEATMNCFVVSARPETDFFEENR